MPNPVKVAETILDAVIKSPQKFIKRYHNTSDFDAVVDILHNGAKKDAGTYGAFFTSARPIDLWNNAGRYRIQFDIPKEKYREVIVENPNYGGQKWSEYGIDRGEDFNSFGKRSWRNYHPVSERGRVDTFGDLDPKWVSKICFDRMGKVKNNYYCLDRDRIDYLRRRLMENYPELDDYQIDERIVNMLR